MAEGGEGVVSRRVYVGNLDWSVAWQDLKDHMAQCGVVVFANVFRYEDGRSKGCGIVEFETADEAKKAITTLNNTLIGSRQIFVREDREDKEVKGSAARPARAPREHKDRPPRQSRPPRQPRPFRAKEANATAAEAVAVDGGDAVPQASGGENTNGRHLFVSNLSWSTKWQDLKDAFKQCGNVIRADVALDSQGRSRGHGFVLFETSTEAQNAIRIL
eukprot:c6776_g1_i1.p1 GENE.c6776_g1_i1~~c6776_g1_i1.p1  ORF type:complete len:217 (+),score=55.18 c6776_g1_i1:65-715(+)